MGEVRHELFEQVLKHITPSSWWFTRKQLTAEMHKDWLEQARSHVHYDCAYMHDHHCTVEGTLGALRWLSKAYKTYLAIHVAQHLLFKKDKFKGKSLLRLLRNILQTYLFFGFYAFFAKFGWCYGGRLAKNFNQVWCLVLCSLGASMIFIERSSRWPEFAMNLIPKYLETLPVYFRKQGRWVEVPLGHQLIMAISVAVISQIYYTSPESIKKMFTAVGSIIVGGREGLLESSKPIPE